LCRRADVDYFFQGNAAEFAADPLAMSAPGAYLDFPTAWRRFVDVVPPEDRGDVVKGLAKAFSSPPRTDAERERLVKAASACVAWEGSASRLNQDENSHGQPNQKYALTADRILVHYMINGGFLGAGGEALICDGATRRGLTRRNGAGPFRSIGLSIRRVFSRPTLTPSRIDLWVCGETAELPLHCSDADEVVCDVVLTAALASEHTKPPLRKGVG
jgi:hypothetical protein